MSINASVQQISGGIAAYVAGLIVVQATPTSELLHYDILGYVVAVSITDYYWYDVVCKQACDA
jgi:hypothetical protein